MISDHAQDVFPAASEHKIRSNPIFSVVKGEEREIVVFDAVLTVRTAQPRKAETGRVVDLEIVDWIAKGHSKFLDSDVTLRMNHNKSLRSPGESFVRTSNDQEGGKDFPAHAQFAMNYDIETKHGQIQGLTGITEGTIRAFPPKPTDVFQMQKGDKLELGAFITGPLACAC